MSALYNVEPQPTGKAVLHTTSGDISLELFGQQTPLATRNFLQHCLDGYYDNTIFHRLVPGFVIQGGDPTGTGSGGQSALDHGQPFEDEFHSRLKFNRRGLLGMANTGTKNDNGSQFFLTLDKADELNGRNTMFGRVEGNTVFNLVKMGEAELTEGEGSERPMFPTMIKTTEILVNPFDDMVKRARIADRTVEDKQDKQDKKKKPKKKLGKQMLSFAGEEEDDEDGGVALPAGPKFNAKLVQANETEAQRAAKPARKSSPPQKADRYTSSKPKPAVPTAAIPNTKQPPQKRVAKSPSPTPSPTPSTSPDPEPTRQEDIRARTEAQIADLKQSLKRSAPTPAAPGPAYKKTMLEEMIPAGATRGRKRKGDAASERKAVADFNAFKLRLDAANVAGSKPAAPNGASAAPRGEGADDARDEEAEPCELHFVPNCQSCRKWDEVEQGGEDDDVHEGVLSHRLTFAKDRLGKDLEWKRQNEKELVVIDPREREKEILKGRRGKGKDSGR